MLPIATSMKLTPVSSIFEGPLVHWPQLRNSHIRPDTPYVNQLANKLETRARRSLNSGMLRNVRNVVQRMEGKSTRASVR